MKTSLLVRLVAGLVLSTSASAGAINIGTPLVSGSVDTFQSGHSTGPGKWAYRSFAGMVKAWAATRPISARELATLQDLVGAT